MSAKQAGAGLQCWGDWEGVRTARGVADDGELCYAVLLSPLGQMTNDEDEKQVTRAGEWSSRS